MSENGHRRAIPWLLAALVASLLHAMTNGTLASWTAATIGNPTNTARAAQAIILRATRGGSTCRSDAVAINESTCTTINSYGGTVAPMWPATGVSTTVTFTNVGSLNGRSFSMTPGACSTRTMDGMPTAPNLCNDASLSMRVRCSAGGSVNTGALWTDLSYPMARVIPANQVLTHTAAGGDLNAGASWTCEVRLELAANAANEVQGAELVQPVTWALRA